MTIESGCRAFLRIYVDDALALFPRRVAASMACVVLILASAPGLLSSWHKVDLGHRLIWIGCNLVFQGCARALVHLGGALD